jgi:hypothetical protein
MVVTVLMWKYMPTARELWRPMNIDIYALLKKKASMEADKK